MRIQKILANAEKQRKWNHLELYHVGTTFIQVMVYFPYVKMGSLYLKKIMVMHLSMTM